MTLTTDRHPRDLVGSHERRGAAATPRRSWASSQPFEPHGDRALVGSSVDSLSWEHAATRYMLRAVAVDVLIGAALSAAVLATLFGPGGIALLGGALSGLGFALFIALTRGYELRSLGDGPAEFQAIVRGGFLLAAAMMGVAYALQLPVPRRLVFVAVPLVMVFSGLARYLQRRLLHRQRRSGEGMMRTVVVGTPSGLINLVEDFAGSPHHGYRIMGVCVPSLDDDHTLLEHEVPVLGAVADVPQVVWDHGIDVVVVAGSAVSGEALRRLSWALGRTGAELVVAPDLVEVFGPRLSLRPTASVSLLRVEVGTSRLRRIAKATLDRTLGGVLALVALPVIGASALAVRLTSSGPAFFRQTRVGVDGREFTMLKLRSMYVDADERRVELLDRSDRDGPMFKMRSDPRVTPVGRFLRRFSLDELPQLFNVVKGDMSLVGPRPPLVSEVATYHDAVNRRLHVRPGVTGLWQISGRADLSWEESVRLDLRYVDNWSVTMDLMILWKTWRAVLKGSGAY